MSAYSAPRSSPDRPPGRPPPRPLTPAVVLRAALLTVLLQVVMQACMAWDVAWHTTPAMRVPFLGLPHPLILPHFGIVATLPIMALLMASLLRPASRKSDDGGGLKLASVLGRRGPVGALAVLGSLGLFLVALGVDSLYHLVRGPAEPLLAPAHLLGFLAHILLSLSLVALLDDLTFCPALGARADQRLARAGLVLALIWLLGSLSIVFPFQPHVYSAHYLTSWLALAMGTGLLVAAQVLPWRFATSMILGLYLSFRVAVAAVLVQVGYTGATIPPESLLVASLAADLWLLLPFNRRRGRLALAGVGLVFGLVWAPLGYHSFLPIADPARASLPKAFLGSEVMALAAAGLALAMVAVAARGNGRRPGSGRCSHP